MTVRMPACKFACVTTPTFFTIMVLMAVVTTGMASPIYQRLSRNLTLDWAMVPWTRRRIVPVASG